MNKNWLLQLTVPIFEPSVFEEKLGTDDTDADVDVNGHAK